jgi:hypothetical protein
MKMLELLIGSAVLLGLTAIPSRADEAAAAQFGRVSAVVGSAQYKSPTGDWSAALVNEPIASGTALRTAQNAEAELRIPGVLVALAPSSELHVSRADENTLQLILQSGRIGVHLGEENAPQTVEIDLPNGGICLQAPGDYDVTVGDAQTPASVQVFAGKARFGGGLDERNLATAAADWFSEWWRFQTDNADTSSDRRPLAKIAGMAALDAAGQWKTDPDLGKVWYPSDLAADWTPFRDGSWRFLPPWGWTWVDRAPWGFATSHYGRWAHLNDRWAWVPGPLLAPTDYNPADVAFLGTAAIGLSQPSDAGPAVAWFPLAPGETIGDGNDANYKNRSFTTAVPRATFAAGLAVASAVVDDIPERRLADAPVILQALGIPPAAAPAVTAAKKPPATFVAAASAPQPKPEPGLHHPLVIAVHAPTPSRMVARPIREEHKRLNVAAIVQRPHPLASPIHSPHNRTHLAATRGGA